VLRPVTEKVVGEAVAHARDAEEKEANAVLAHLEQISVDDPNFDAQLAAFEEAVDRHAEAEEQEEFPQILATCEESERQTMGRRIRAVEAIAPTHPHPTVAGNRNLQLLTGPLASFVDRARDAIGSIR
jgi:hemerythrin superfamily protein